LKEKKKGSKRLVSLYSNLRKRKEREDILERKLSTNEEKREGSQNFIFFPIQRKEGRGQS